MADEIGLPTQEALDLLRPRLRAHYIETPEPKTMIQIAMDLLVEGIETPAVLRCACMSPVDDRDDIRDEFYDAMAELGVPKMSYDDAALEEIRYLAPAIVATESEERAAAIHRIRELYDFDDYAYAPVILPENMLWLACWLGDSARAEQQLDLEECAITVMRSDPSDRTRQRGKRGLAERLANPAGPVTLPPVLHGWCDLRLITRYCRSIDELLHEVSNLALFEGTATVAPMEAVTNYLCGYVTSDDLSLELECVLLPNTTQFGLEFALAVYDEDTDCWQPQFESNSTATSPEAALTWSHDSLAKLVCGIRDSHNVDSIAALVALANELDLH